LIAKQPGVRRHSVESRPIVSLGHAFRDKYRLPPRSSWEGPHMVDQEIRRQPGFRSGLSVRLADGQFWTFPVPSVRNTAESGADLDEEGPPSPTYDALLRAMGEADDDSELFLTELAFAIELLSRNYRLGAAEYRGLLSFAVSDPARSSLRNDLHGLAQIHLRRSPERSAAVQGARHGWLWGISSLKSRHDQRRVANPAA
jgi:hypothetical protein